MHAALPDAVLRPVRDRNAFEACVEHLAMAIRLGVFTEGERLPPERELAERLRVGRATLRDAIGALRQAGLVTTTRGRTGGTVVIYRGNAVAEASDAGSAGPAGLRSRSDMDDVLAFRRVVEPGAAYLAASADLSAGQRSWLVDALQAASTATDDGARRVADSRLHLAVATLSGSAMLVDAVSAVRSAVAELLERIPVIPKNIEHSDAQHAALVDAVLAGRAASARQVMEDHCDATSALLRGLLT